VAALAVLTVGGVCVNLEPSHPRARHQKLIELINPEVLLCSTTLAKRAHGLAPLVFSVSAETVSKSAALRDQPEADDESEQTAYMIFTSGSTGIPKGVVLQHRALVTSLMSAGHYVGWCRGLRALQFTSYIWDASIGEIFGTLIFGGCVCIPSAEKRESGLADYIKKVNVEWIFQTPAALQNLFPDEIPNVKTVVTGGDRVQPESAITWGSKLRLINAWGPCESSIYATFADLGPQTKFPETIGRPVGCAVWIANPTNPARLVPIGAVGELIIESATVAKGYFRDGSATTAAFIDAPAWAPRRSQALTRVRRFYRTGDLGKYNDDGSICFIGRRDHQVKIRGQRLELGEIESVTAQCPAVRAVAVISHTSRSRTELVAILALDDPHLPRTGVLKEHGHQYHGIVAELASSVRKVTTTKLPLYMVPDRWLVVQDLPRAASSKVDRQAIAHWLRGKGSMPDSILDADDRQPLTISPPESAAEKMLQTVWSTVLDVPEDQVGRESSFLRLGGDSITAMQVATRSRRLGLQLSVQTLMLHPTLSDTAAECKQSLPAHVPYGTQSSTTGLSDVSTLGSIGELDVDGVNPLFDQICAHATFLDKEGIESAAVATDAQASMLAVGGMPRKACSNEFYIDCKKGLDIARLNKACAQVFRHHPVLRTIFVQVEDTVCQVVLHDGYFVAWQNDALRSDNGLQEESARSHVPSFSCENLSSDGLLCHRIRLRIHHALYDAIFIQLVLDDIASAYRGRPLAIGMPFHSWIAQIGAKDFTDTKTFWKDMLHTSCMTFLHPLNEPCRLKTLSGVSRASVPIHRLESSAGTKASVFKAAWATVLSRELRIQDVVFGQVTANRSSDFLETGQVLGPCLNYVPVRAHPTGGKDFSSLVQEIDAQHHASVPHHDLGFRQIIRDCTEWPSWTQFGSLVVFQNHGSKISESQGLRFLVDDMACALSGYGQPTDASDICVVAEPDEHAVNIILHYIPGVISRQQAERLLTNLTTVLETGHLEPLSPLSENIPPAASTWSLVAADPNGGIGNPESHDGLPTQRNQSLVSKAWHEVRLIRDGVSPEADVSMFDCRADIVSALLLSMFYQRHGCDIGVADIVRNGTQRSQAFYVDDHETVER
jgi:amino acid adenylation domain-containing protein